MSDTPNEPATPPSAGGTGDNGATPPAPSTPPQDTTSDKVPSSWDEVFNHPRFVELNKGKKTAEEKLAQYEAEQKKAKEDAAVKQGEFEKLYNEAQPKLNTYDEMETSMKEMLNAELESIPDDKKSLIPSDYPPHKQLAWIAKNRSILGGTTSVNPPVNPPKDGSQGGAKKTFTSAQLNDPDYYAEHADELKLAVAEGRIVD